MQIEFSFGVCLMTPYLLDANVFIQAKNLHYGMDFCPAFWDWLIIRNRAGNVASIEKVGDELKGGEDELSRWAKIAGSSFFLPPKRDILPALERTSVLVQREKYEASAVATFLQVADYWLIAHALTCNGIVVTHEIPSDSKRKIKIPNVCIGLGVKFVNPYEMLRRERARFVLEPHVK